MGIAWATVLIRISFPAFDNNFSFHPINFLANLALISLKEFFLFLPTNESKPKYFSCCLITYVLRAFKNKKSILFV